ncbi:MAG: AAA family ATPase [Candidatus Hodarchaeota archaeon]
MNIKVIGAVGLNGSGKDTVLRLISDYLGCPLISIGDLVRDIAKKQKIQLTRENLNKISERYISAHGKEYFPRLVAAEIRKISPKIACVTGIRTPHDVRVLREEFGHDFILLSVETDQNTRLERLKIRAEARDPHSFSDFLKQEKNEEKIFHVSTTMRLANYVISNNGSLDELRTNVRRFLEEARIE